MTLQNSRMVMFTDKHKLIRFARPAISFLVPFALYLLTLAPTIYNLDSAELTTAAATLGLSRATGYPFFILLGHLWSMVPIGDIGYRMNLFSALCGATTIFLADQVLIKWKVSWVASFGGLCLLAVAPYFWGLSLIAEVYTLHTALMAGILLALQRWDEKPTPGRLMFLSAVVGLSWTHHAAAFLLIPGIVVYLLLSNSRILVTPRYWLPALGAGLLAVGIYLYLPLRVGMNPSFNYAGYYAVDAVFIPYKINTWHDFWWLISGQGFSNLMFAYPIPGLLTQMTTFGKELVRTFFVIGIGPGFVGLILLFFRNRKISFLFLLWFVFTAGFYINYKVGDKATMFLPCYLVWGMAISVCYDQFIRWMDSGKSILHDLPLRLLQTIVILSVIVATVWNWPLVNQNDRWDIRWEAEKRLSNLPQNSAVIGYWDTIPVMEYLQKVEGFRPDVLLINRFLVPNEVYSPLIMELSSQRPLYLAFRPSSLPGLSTIQENQLYRVIP